MDGIEIVRARAEDLPAILAISNWAAAHTNANFATEPERLEDWRATFEKTEQQHCWLVARQAERVIGFARTGPHKARGSYAWCAEVSIYIDAAHHGRGVGAALYGRLLPIARRQGYVTLLAGITSGHRASEGLHAKVGFARCGTYPRVGYKNGAWHDVGWWALHLAGDGAPGAIRAVADVWSD